MRISRTPILVALFAFLISCENDNLPPKPDFIVSPMSGSVETVFLFDASPSVDWQGNKGNILYRWDWENDGNFDTGFSSNRVVNHQFSEKGEYTVVLEIIDRFFQMASARKIVVVSDGTGPDINYGELFDQRDGQTYRTVKIGEQWWMAENLNYGRMIPGMADQLDNRIAEKYCIGDSERACDQFGGLYQWDEAMNYTQNYRTGLCPQGWHVPSDGEIMQLEEFLGVNEGLRDFGWRGPGAATKLERGGSTGFNAIYHGYRRHDGEFHSWNTLYVWWSSTEYDYNAAVYRAIEPFSTTIHRNNWYKKSGYSIRCIKDE